MTEESNLPVAPFEGFRHDLDDKPMTAQEAREQFEIGVNIVKASELVDEPFIILSARPFQGRYKASGLAYFCECTDLKHKEVWGTVIGGGQPVEFLTAYIAKGAPAPLEVTLTKHEGGQSERYYLLE